MTRSRLRLKTPQEFRWHLIQIAGFAVAFLVVSLGLGILGYRWFAGLGWIDSFFNASMILTGMGPVDPMPTDGAKIFASLYAIYGGAVYPALTAVVLYPFVHRMMVALHLQSQDKD